MKTKIASVLFLLVLVGCGGNLNTEQKQDILKFIDEGMANLEAMKLSKGFFLDAGYPEEPKNDRNQTKMQFEMAYRKAKDGTYLNACFEINSVYLQIYQVILGRKIEKATSKELLDELPGKYEFLEDERKKFAAAGLNAMLGSPKSLLTGKSDAKPITKPQTVSIAIVEINKQLDGAKLKLKELKVKF